MLKSHDDLIQLGQASGATGPVRTGLEHCAIGRGGYSFSHTEKALLVTKLKKAGFCDD